MSDNRAWRTPFVDLAHLDAWPFACHRRSRAMRNKRSAAAFAWYHVLLLVSTA